MTNPVPSHPAVTTPWGIPGSWAAGRHTGEDYGSPGINGAKVVAAAAGRVEVAGTSGGWGSAYGTQVIIDHGGVKALYAHLSAVHVRVGTHVQAGDRIGSVGTTGNSTGPHLHYEERTAPFTYGSDRRPQLPTDQEDDMPLTSEDIEKIAKAVWRLQIEMPKESGADSRRADWLLKKAADKA